jgi:hypothetical protein
MILVLVLVLLALCVWCELGRWHGASQWALAKGLVPGWLILTVCCWVRGRHGARLCALAAGRVLGRFTLRKYCWRMCSRMLDRCLDGGVPIPISGLCLRLRHGL